MLQEADRQLLKGFGLQIHQSTDGYRFSLDPFLLCGFVRVAAAEKVLDLGTGVGVIPLLLTSKFELQECVGIEIQQRAATLARRNCAVNHAGDQVRIIEGDLRRHKEIFAPQSFDVVVTNPPYRSLNTGKAAPNLDRAAARHELAGGLVDFVTAAAYLLGNGGRFYAIYLAERLTDLLATMRLKNLEPKRLRLVHSRVGEDAKLVLIEGRRAGNPGLKVDSPLYIYAGDRYSDEVLACYGESAD
jgi:tRNA1Val (adenine37-N6)-methyltransferase